MARRRRSLLETARKGLLEGIETLTRYEGAQKAAAQARQDLNDALSGDPATDGQGAPTSSERMEPTAEEIKRFNKAHRKSLELIRSINREQEMQNAVTDQARDHIRDIHDLRDRIGRLTERETTLESELQNMTGERLEKGRDLLSRIRDQREELRKQLETQRDLLEAERMRSDVEESEQPPAPAPPETLGGSLGDILLSRGEAERAIQNIKAEMNEMIKGVGIEEDLLEKFGLDVDEFAKRLDKLRGELKRSEIDPETFFKQAQEQFKQFKDQILAVIDAMETLGFISQSEAKAARQALESVGDEAEDSEEKIESLGEGIQDTARLVRGIGDLAGQFGDLSDEAEAAVEGLVGRITNGEDVVLVCFEGENKRCHRHLLVDHLRDRLGR
jgi:chromosome segregation ATPase